ncbi:putative Fe-Mo cluster-binding NifX family protein [Thermovibrio guaymasensis]|uniref:Putative Fe-Mo cluster-binding NifX family protein n=1 Tax=Thermovibrio guaymasensis TaxID=240167 RepID=A0A420W8U6_9BACT|nr:NifB/NifX family molybdenum-iron cluster-binding protein [Thermovibrio guaymasensis]RKQ63740.1 putative Fe-Mo cluster-binding NifX family protein [Thermovibrio guaymasensis]
MKFALPVKSAEGPDVEVLSTFEGAPYLAILTLSEEGVKVDFFENPASSRSEIAQFLLSLGVKKVVFPSAKPLVKSALNQLGIEVVDRSFRTLKEAVYALF